MMLANHCGTTSAPDVVALSLPPEYVQETCQSQAPALLLRLASGVSERRHFVLLCCAAQSLVKVLACSSLSISVLFLWISVHITFSRSSLNSKTTHSCSNCCSFLNGTHAQPSAVTHLPQSVMVSDLVGDLEKIFLLRGYLIIYKNHVEESTLR